MSECRVTADKIRTLAPGIKNLVKEVMEDIHSLCRHYIGASYTGSYADEQLNICSVPVRTPQTILPRSINKGFESWIETVDHE